MLGLWQCYVSEANQGAYITSLFFVSGGLAFTLTHIVLYYRKVLGVYPTWS